MDSEVELFGKQNINRWAIIILVSLSMVFFISSIYAAIPQGPDSLISINNSTKGNTSALMFNLSGGYIAKFNLSATLQNTRWKAFAGNITGKFTLDDAAGETIYDWTLSTISGRIYATRNSSAPTWSNLVCANNTTMETENTVMYHANLDDNITTTFGTKNHPTFVAAGKTMTANSCPTVRPYVSETAQSTRFNETALYDGINHIFSAQLESNQAGYDDAKYDFQMIVPENASASFGSATAYYLYVELE